MFFIEISLTLLFIGGFCTWLLLSERILAWKDKREADRVAAAMKDLEGKAIENVLERFGPPREHFEGSSGRSLYVWRRPPSPGLPRVRGLLVVTLTVDEAGHVVESSWQRR